MADSKTFLDYIFKKMKNACNIRYILFMSVDKIRFALIMNGILEMSWFVHIFL